MPRSRLRGLLSRPFLSIFFGLGALCPKPAPAEGCTSSAPFSTCFDANSLWLPAGRAFFATLADTEPTSVGQIAFGIAGEYLRRPITLQVSSPDRGGREVGVLSDAVDASYFLAFGVLPELEFTLAASVRTYQRGAGAGGISSQTAAPLDPSALRQSRVGFGYSLDHALRSPGIGLRLGLEAALPLGNSDAFAGERSVVVMPSVTSAFTLGRLRIALSVGARLRSALEFGGVRVGNQGYFGLGFGYDLLQPGVLCLSVEAFALPALSESRAASANAQVQEARLLPAEALASVQSSFGTSGTWSLRLAAGGGLPFSSETRAASNAVSERRFLGLGTPDFRSLIVVRFQAPAPP